MTSGLRGSEYNDGDARPNDALRLVAQLAASRASVASQRRLLASGLTDLLGADGWLWDCSRVSDGPALASTGLQHGGLSEAQVAGLVRSHHDPGHPPLHAALIRDVQAGRQPLTAIRHDLLPDSVWYTLPRVKQDWLDHQLDHCVYYLAPIDEAADTIMTVALFRRLGAEPFTKADCQFVHAVLTALDHLHQTDTPAGVAELTDAMTPRLRRVLVLLLEGHNRDEIADMLGISPHTAKDYIKKVYRHFEVGSQVRLIRRFRQGPPSGAIESALRESYPSTPQHDEA